MRNVTEGKKGEKCTYNPHQSTLKPKYWSLHRSLPSSCGTCFSFLLQDRLLQLVSKLMGVGSGSDIDFSISCYVFGEISATLLEYDLIFSVGVSVVFLETQGRSTHPPLHPSTHHKYNASMSSASSKPLEVGMGVSLSGKPFSAKN
jgi:hypothetical protein